MRRGIFSTGSRPKAGCRPPTRAATRRSQHSKPHGARSPPKCGARFLIFNKARTLLKRKRKTGARSDATARKVDPAMRSKFATAILLMSILPTAPGITLDGVLNTTLEKNPAIQQAKANLEQAAGRRLILRSIVWPNVKVN